MTKVDDNLVFKGIDQVFTVLENNDDYEVRNFLLVLIINLRYEVVLFRDDQIVFILYLDFCEVIGVCMNIILDHN